MFLRKGLEIHPFWPLLEVRQPPVQIQQLILKVLNFGLRSQFRGMKKIAGIIPEEVKRLCNVMEINFLVVFRQQETSQCPCQHSKPFTKPSCVYRLLR